MCLVKWIVVIAVKGAHCKWRESWEFINRGVASVSTLPFFTGSWVIFFFLVPHSSALTHFLAQSPLFPHNLNSIKFVLNFSLSFFTKLLLHPFFCRWRHVDVSIEVLVLASLYILSVVSKTIIFHPCFSLIKVMYSQVKYLLGGWRNFKQRTNNVCWILGVGCHGPFK